MENNPNVLEIKNLSKSFEDSNGTVKALEEINLSIEKGEFITIVGQSGCGKSTLLRLISGLDKEYDGEILFEGNKVKGTSNDIGMVFQEARLFPWKTVKENILYSLDKKISKEEKEKIVDEYLELVQLKDFKNSYPNQLSGGMQQRISIARALANNPRILLFDEPFGALDALTRINMQNEVLRIWKAEKKNMILVTHDIDEAIYLGDKVVIMSSRPGTIKKVVKIELGRPRNRTSYDFMKTRKEIYDEFFEEPKSEIEYNI